MDFLLVIIELFSVAVMLVELSVNNRLEIAVLQWGGSLLARQRVVHFMHKIYVQGDVSHQSFVHA